ncbi:MAG: DMT family transporter [Pseudomonadota bacterium]
MRLLLLTALTMVAFAANSLLNRLALIEGAIGPAEFAVVRVAAGAAMLALLVVLRERSVPAPARPDILAVAGLSVYMLGFSFAYVSMDAGLGALILFGGVQVTMFLGALIKGERPPALRWLGMLVALAGLALLTWPGEAATAPPVAMGLMSAAALGWGLYSLIGRRVTDPLASTGWNFVYSVPVVLLALLVPTGASQVSTMNGLILAVLSGALTSALGYALWYALLPQLGASVAALAQLSVPVIAIILGALLLGEAVTVLTASAAALILGGIALGLVPGARRGP